jgi:hypothetical protein
VLRTERRARVGLDGTVADGAWVVGAAGDAEASIALDRDGGVQATGTGCVHGDGFEARGRANLADGALTGEGRLHARVGGMDASLAGDSSGAVSAGLDTSGALGANTAYGLHLGRTAEHSAARARLEVDVPVAGAPRLSGNVALRTSEPARVSLGDDGLSELRRATLAQLPGAVFERLGHTGKAESGLGLTLPLGGVALEAGFSGGSTVAVEQVRIRRAGQAGPRPDAPVDAAEIAALEPGESVAWSGHGRFGARLLGGVTAAAAVLGGATARAGVEATVAVESDASLRVTRETGDRVRLTLEVVRSRTHTRDEKLKLGVELRLPGAGPLGHPFLDAAKKALRDRSDEILRDVAHARVERGVDQQEGTTRVLDVRLSLAEASHRQALDRALAGDWTELESLCERGEAQPLASVFSRVRSEGVAAAQAALGFSRGDEVRTSSRRERRASGAGATLRETHTFRHVRSWKNPWGGAAKRALATEVSTSSAAPGASGTLSWGRSRTRVVTSRQQLEAALSIADFVAGAAFAEQVGAYRVRLAGVADDQVLGLGPRNELKKTQASLDVRIDAAGLDVAADYDEDALWRVASEAAEAAHPQDAVPLWAKEAGRRSLETHGPLRHTHAEYAPYHEVRSFLEALSEVATADVATRTRRLRTLLDASEDDATLMAVLARVAGPEHVAVSLEVEASDPAVAVSLAG